MKIRSAMTFVLLACCLAVGGLACAQEATPAVADPTNERMTRIEEHLRQLEAHNRQLQEKYDSLMSEYEKILHKDKTPVFGLDAHNPDGSGILGGLEFWPDTPVKSGGGVNRTSFANAGEEENNIPGAGGLYRSGAGISEEPARVPLTRVGLLWFRDNDAEIAGRGPYRPDMPAQEHRIGVNAFFGGPENGLTWQSSDQYFSMTFHNMTQLDLREPFQQGDPLHGGFILPRQRWYLEGKVGDYVNFVTSINRGYSSLDLLDAYVDVIVHPEWLSFSVGRMKTPSEYEYISFDPANLIGPERSLYVQNFAGNRQLGAMAHGRLFNRHIEYYIGAFNGQRNSFEDYNSSRDFYSYLDYRPFIQSGVDWLKGLHLVGAYNGGEERNPLSPFALRTMNQQSNSDAAAFVSPTILEFSNGAFENGPRQFWSYETVYYYRSFGFLTGIQGGYQDYSLLTTNPTVKPGNAAASTVASITSPFAATRQNANNEFLDVQSPFRTHVPIMGWSFQAWYFITGEEISRRRYLVEPRRPFGYYNGSLHPGAIELFAKVSDLQLGDSVFRGGIANRALWTNRAFAPEVGFNWYLTHFVKFTFDYQHVFLGNPVVLDEAAQKFTKSYDMLLFRTQLFF